MDLIYTGFRLPMLGHSDGGVAYCVRQAYVQHLNFLLNLVVGEDLRKMNKSFAEVSA